MRGSDGQQPVEVAASARERRGALTVLGHTLGLLWVALCIAAYARLLMQPLTPETLHSPNWVEPLDSVGMALLVGLLLLGLLLRWLDGRAPAGASPSSLAPSARHPAPNARPGRPFVADDGS